MEDYIFLIIAVVLAVFGAINQNRKKKIESGSFPKSEKASEFHFMDQFLNHDFFDEPAKIVNPVRIVSSPVKVVEKKPAEVSREKFYHQGFKSTLPDRPKREPILTIKKQAENEEVVDEETISYLEDFSLRKAFVYAEILTRKY